MGYEIAEQLNWKLPKHIVVPSAGGSLITKIWKSFNELKKLEFVNKVETKVYCAQGHGCSPIVTAIKEKADIIKPVKPKTIAKSLAIGNPADGYYAVDTVRSSGGYGEEATDEEIIEAKVIPHDESIVLCITGNGLKTHEVVSRALAKPVKIRRFINFYINDEDIRFLKQDETLLEEGNEVSIIPAIAGG